MNSLRIGLGDKIHWLRSKATPPFFYLGENIEPFLSHRVKVFDPERDHFNPLTNIAPERALELAEILYAADPGGDTTLTVRNGKQALAEMLVNITRLDKLTGDDKDPAEAEALRTVRGVLFFPRLKKILCTGPQFDFSGSVVAKIDRAKLGPKQALTLALLLMAQAKGQLLVPEGGLYLRPLHLSLMSENRLAVGLRTFSQITDPQLRQELELVADKSGAFCTYEDAVVLAKYAGLVPGTDGHTTFVQERMKG
jgi:hypothetical protein